MLIFNKRNTTSISEVPAAGFVKSLRRITAFEAWCDPSHMCVQRFDMEGLEPMCLPILEVQHPKTVERPA